MIWRRFSRDEQGAAAVEMAFALPCFVLMIWILVQLGLVFRATAGVQHALGEGARAATVWSEAGVDTDDIKDRINDAVYGIGPGTFSEPSVEPGVGCDDMCLDISVTYTQPTNLLVFPGPTFTITRTKRVWTAGETS